MSLRKSPARTPALLAACRANAQKSTGPRTSEGKARVALNALRHGRYARVLPYAMPRGASFQDRMLYNWIRRAIENCFQPHTQTQRGKVLRTALQVWCEIRAELAGEKACETAYVTEKRPVRSYPFSRELVYRLERASPRGVLTFKTHFSGRPPRRSAGGGERDVASVAPRARGLRAVWRGEGLVADWHEEPLPGPADTAAFYHWQRDIERERQGRYRSERRQKARVARSGEAAETMSDWLADIVAAWRAAQAKPGQPALPGGTSGATQDLADLKRFLGFDP